MLREVHATRLLRVSPRLQRLLELYGWIIDHTLVVMTASATLFAASAHALWRRWRRRGGGAT